MRVYREPRQAVNADSVSLSVEPGGYLQWSEQDPTTNDIICAPGSFVSTEATQDLLKFLNKPRESINFRYVDVLRGGWLPTSANSLFYERCVPLADRSQCHSFRWVSQLGSRLSTHLALISFDRQSIPQEHQAFWNISVLQACEEFSSNMRRRVESDEDSEKAKTLQDATDGASAELLNGVGIRHDLVVAVVQKPKT